MVAGKKGRQLNAYIGSLGGHVSQISLHFLSKEELALSVAKGWKNGRMVANFHPSFIPPCPPIPFTL